MFINIFLHQKSLIIQQQNNNDKVKYLFSLIIAWARDQSVVVYLAPIQ